MELKEINVGGVEIPINNQLSKVHYSFEYEYNEGCREFYGCDLSDVLENINNASLHQFVYAPFGKQDPSDNPHKSYLINMFTVARAILWGGGSDFGEDVTKAELYLRCAIEPNITWKLHINGLGKVYKLDFLTD